MITKEPLTTSGVARRLERSEQTVRSWVRSGRLHPVAVTASGINLFDPRDIDRVAQELAAAK